ncbi:MAG: FAD:protein FMN transferase [Clostridia bacterium]|nr:FAD:protein FMN transferase [Clostridia bacterium]
MKLIKFLPCLCLVLGLLVVLTGCPETAHKAEPRGMVYFSFFDTVSYVYSYASDSEADFTKNCDEVAAILEDYHHLFDIYYEYSGINNLKTINLNAGGDPIEVDQRLIDFLLYAKELYALTNGEMNIMMGAVLRPWHDSRSAASNDPQNARIPSMDTLISANAHTDISLLEIDDENNTVRISDPLASVDVGALGKGYATEMAAKRLKELGVTSYVLNIGGNIRIIGTKPDGSGWRTGVKDPQNTDNYALYLNLANTSCVTSGVYERFFTVDGVRYHHIIDKDTLMPSEFFTSLTVICEDSGLADALSTALFSMSYEDGLKFVDSLDGVEVLWIYGDGEMKMSEGLKSLVQ